MLGNKSNSVLRIRVGVVGGGIGGLAAAVALSRLGHDVTVYEAASKISEVRQRFVQFIGV
jgi:2-polyprenyl-6-methoxyphenol hydroxylase-like FAD-dependent oxidoreductase